ncbi:hypothetical protein [Niabella aquatica]
MNTIKQLLLLLAIISIAGCSKEDNSSARYDKNSLGSYSGVLVGSSGYITIELKSTGATVTIVFDDATYQLSSAIALQPGTKVTGYTLQKDGVKVVMDVNADGSVPQVAVTIPGHDVTAVVFKVTSSVAVENYIGTFSNTDSELPQYNNSGILNFTIHGNDVIMLSKCKTGDCGGTAYIKMTGKVVRNTNGFTINFDNCNPNDTVCTLAFTKTATGYRYVEVIAPGGQFVVEVKKAG